MLYPYRSDWVNGVPDPAADMRAARDSFTVIPPSLTMHAPPQGGNCRDRRVVGSARSAQWLEWLFAREAFDVFVVNYTFFSKAAFEFAPRQRRQGSGDARHRTVGARSCSRPMARRPEFFYHDTGAGRGSRWIGRTSSWRSRTRKRNICARLPSRDRRGSSVRPVARGRPVAAGGAAGTAAIGQASSSALTT